MKTLPLITLIIFTVTVLFAFSIMPRQTAEVPYPTGYRNWTHVKSKLTMSGDPAARSGVYHHIYANALALEGYKTGKFPNGAVIVADFIAAIDSNASFSEGRRKYIDVMVRDTGLYPGTGGWGFEEFEHDSKTARKVNLVNMGACFNCHKSQEKNDFVYSKYRE